MVKLHLRDSITGFNTLCLLGASILLLLSAVIRGLRVLYRNFVFGRRLPTANIRTGPEDHTLLVSINVSRHWKVRAGQYIYIWMPVAGIFQSHPFSVIWWDDELIWLLIQPRHGLTGKMQALSGGLWTHYAVNRSTTARKYDYRDNGPYTTVLVDGPYGHQQDLQPYGTVLIIATGIGIAAQLPYIKELLNGCYNGETKTRRISVFWEKERKGDHDCIADWWDELLLLDRDKRVSDSFLLSCYKTNHLFRYSTLLCTTSGGSLPTRVEPPLEFVNSLAGFRSRMSWCRRLTTRLEEC